MVWKPHQQVCLPSQPKPSQLRAHPPRPHRTHCTLSLPVACSRPVAHVLTHLRAACARRELQPRGQSQKMQSGLLPEFQVAARAHCRARAVPAPHHRFTTPTRRARHWLYSFEGCSTSASFTPAGDSPVVKRVGCCAQRRSRAIARGTRACSRGRVVRRLFHVRRSVCSCLWVCGGMPLKGSSAAPAARQILESGLCRSLRIMCLCE